MMCRGCLLVGKNDSIQQMSVSGPGAVPVSTYVDGLIACATAAGPSIRSVPSALVTMISTGTPLRASENAQVRANCVVAAATGGCVRSTCAPAAVLPPRSAPMSSGEWMTSLMCDPETASRVIAPTRPTPVHCAGPVSQPACPDSAGSYIERKMECAVRSTPRAPGPGPSPVVCPEPEPTNAISTTNTQTDYLQSLLTRGPTYMNGDQPGARTYARITTMEQVVTTKRPVAGARLAQQMDEAQRPGPAIGGRFTQQPMDEAQRLATVQSRFAEFFPVRPLPPPCPFDPPGPQPGVPLARLAPCIPTQPRVM